MENRKILIVNTKSSNRKLTGMVMWGAWAVASYFKATISGGDVIFLDENNEDNFLAKLNTFIMTDFLRGYLGGMPNLDNLKLLARVKSM